MEYTGKAGVSADEQTGEGSTAMQRIRAAMLMYIRNPQEAAAAFPDVIGGLHTYHPRHSEHCAGQAGTDGE